MAELSERAARLAEKLLNHSPQADALGMEMIGLDDKVVTVQVPWRPDLVGDPEGEVIAGGVVTSLLDHACGLAVQAVPERGWPAATLDLRIDYMRPAAARASIIAQAHCYKFGRSVAFVRATAYDVEVGDPIATAQAAFIYTGKPRE